MSEDAGTVRLEVRTTPEVRKMLEDAATVRGLVVASGGRRQGEANLAAVISALATEDHERRTSQPTLLQRAKDDAEGTRELMLAALLLAGGNAEDAREQIGPAIGRTGAASERDWRSARDLLGLSGEIAKRWPARRAKE